MGYDNDKEVRKRRSKGVDELYKMVDDVVWVENQVKKMPYFSRRYYHRKLRSLSRAVEDDYVCMTIECNLQMVNDAYESTIQYSRKPSFKEYFSLKN